MKIQVEHAHFVTRSFAYTCSFLDVARSVMSSSLGKDSLSKEKKPDCMSWMTHDFVVKFLSKNDVSPAKKIAKWWEYRASHPGLSDSDALRACAKQNDIIVFLMDTGKLKAAMLKRQKALMDTLQSVESDGSEKADYLIFAQLKRLRKAIKHPLSRISDPQEKDYWNGILGEIQEAISWKGDDDGREFFSSILKNDRIDKLHRFIKKIKSDSLFHHGPIYEKAFPALRDLDKLISKTRQFLRITRLLESCQDVALLATVAKDGVISLSLFVNSGSLQSDAESLDIPRNRGENDPNRIISVGNSIAKRIGSERVVLPAFFSFFDANAFFGFTKKETILDDPSKTILSKKEKGKPRTGKDLCDRFPAAKVSYLRFISTPDHAKEKDIMLLFDYVSLLCAYGKTYDPYYLWCVVQRNKKEMEPHDRIVDRVSKSTEHFYVEDMGAVLSVINPETNIGLLNDAIKDESFFLSADTHDARVYSFWDFKYACYAFCFGGMAVLANHLFASVISRMFNHRQPKFTRVYKLHFLARIASQIEGVFDTSFYGAKPDSNVIVKSVYSHLGLPKYEKGREETTKQLWQEGNLVNGQYYNRIGIVFSMASLLITVLGFGLIGFVALKNPCYRPPENPWEFFAQVMTSPKVLFVFLLACLPLLVWLTLYIVEWVKYYNYSLPKKAGYEGISFERK